MIEFTKIEKDVLIEKIGILQPSGRGIETEGGLTLDTYTDVLRALSEDTETPVSFRDKINEILYGDIVDPMTAISSLLEYSTSNKDTGDGKLTEDFKVNDTSVGITTVTLKNGNAVLTGTAATEAARASLGIRDKKKISLLRSGFWIAIGKISTTDVIDLETRLTDVALELRESMLGLEYTSDAYIYLEVIMDFIEEHMLASSLDVPFTEIRKHILAVDAELLYGGIIDAIEPRGFVNYFRCGNALKIEEKPVKEGSITDDTLVDDITGMGIVCGNVFTAKLHCSSLLRVADWKLSSEQRIQLLKTKNALSVEDVKAYQESFINNIVESVVTDEEITFKFSIVNATISKIIEIGAIHHTNISLALNNLPIGDDVKLKNQTYKKYYTDQALALFAPYIKTITLDGGSIINGEEDILNVLADVTTNPVLAGGISKAISEYIDSSLIAIFGVPEFICSDCNKVHGEDTKKHDFKGFLPINMRKYFFILLTLKG